MTEYALKETQREAEEKAKQLPKPTGYRILCMVPKVAQTYAGKIAKPDETVRIEEQTTSVLFVVDLGPDAYKDKTKFPSGPWCKKGDFIVVRTYSGTRINIHGTEFRLINDDTVDATVEDPRGVGRA